MTIAFCGHSTFSRTPEIEEQLLSILESQVGDEPADLFLGGYGSFDSFAREWLPKISIGASQCKISAYNAIYDHRAPEEPPCV